MKKKKDILSKIVGEEMKIIDSVWFNGKMQSDKKTGIGIIITEEESTRNKKVFIGITTNIGKKQAEELIIKYGQNISVDILEYIVNVLKEK